MTPGDRNVVDNLRREYGQKIEQWSDEIIAKTWREFSQSDEYPDKDQKFFPLWCEAVALD